MATQADIRRIVLALPETSEDPRGFRFFVDGKQFVWSWLERPEPRGPRVPQPDVIAVRVASELEKQSLIALNPAIFFTEPHYDGYPAVLVRLGPIDLDLLTDVLQAGWRARAPRRLRRELAD